jgi:hypothetical protein
MEDHVKRSIAALSIAISLSGIMTPVSADPIFKGVVGIESATSACGILPYVEQGNLFRIVLRPANVGTNPSVTDLIIDPMAKTFTDLIISSFKLNGSLNSTYQDVDVAQTTSNDQFSLNFETFGAKILMAEPASGIVDAADYVMLKLKIRRFGNVAHCTVTLRGVMTDKATPLL